MTFSIQPESGGIRGYASIFNSPDLARDIIMPGAFRNSLRRRGARKVRMLYQHEASEPVGVWHHLEEDEKGLYVEGRLLVEVQQSREIGLLIGAGALDGLSIGFRTIRSSPSRGQSRFVHEIDLVEISIVTFPMHPEARIRREGIFPRGIGAIGDSMGGDSMGGDFIGADSMGGVSVGAVGFSLADDIYRVARSFTPIGN